MVFDLDQRAVGHRSGRTENGAGVNPRMARQDAVSGARFQ